MDKDTDYKKLYHTTYNELQRHKSALNRIYQSAKYFRPQADSESRLFREAQLKGQAEAAKLMLKVIKSEADLLKGGR